jgi:putative membrane protein
MRLVAFRFHQPNRNPRSILVKKIALALVAISVIATPALSQSLGEKTGINSITGTAPKTQDFVKEAAISDMFEIQSSQLAQSKAADAGVKSFASQMVTDHSATSAELKDLVSGGKVKAQLPTAMDSSHKKKLDKLQKLNGADFDKQYVSDQRSAHKTAVSLFQRYAKGGDNADLKAFAAKYLPKLQGHLKMAQDLGKKK